MGSLLVPIAHCRRLVAAAGTIVAALGLVGLAGCSASGASTDQQINYVTGKAVLTTYAVGHRQSAPEVSGVDLEGQPLDLAQFRGKVVVLNFWASWCPPCRAEAAALEQVSTDTRGSGVQFVGVDIRENGPNDGRNFVATHHVDYPSFDDQAAKIALAFRSTGIAPEVPPSTLIIDRTGHIAARALGELTFRPLEDTVKRIAAEQS
jgi:thiol-disulfide isomerase/thioredoxin